ncbi:hypothetical protein [Robbsia andropogonis]|uniref:hypothetical protein n=1 Tax=Robbsia andropogonis TaxID=28092 RepID=UPI0004638643|nr:hypothetical protein [Robbsia andropogonis]
MALDLSLLLFHSRIPDDNAESPLATVVNIEAPSSRCGDNGLFLHTETMRWRELITGTQDTLSIESTPFNFQIFNAVQRQQTRTARARISALDPTLASATLVVTLALVHHADRVSVYHYAHEGETGALFLHLLDIEPFARDAWTAWCDVAQSALACAAKSRALLNDDCWYSRWRPDMELERKFTSQHIPDMWQLAIELHAAIGAGHIDAVILELDRDFQCYDYESHIFEVTGDPREAGYIAFIPQANGLMAVKRKWFVKNEELRREDFNTDHAIAFDAIEQHARSLTSARLQRLKPFRRTRFDVNCESLDTGNGFGIYLDICRMVDGSASFAQIEVEYCRSRTLKALRDVESDFERIATAVHQFLIERGHRFQHDLYSKLDFAREASQLAA